MTFTAPTGHHPGSSSSPLPVRVSPPPCADHPRVTRTCHPGCRSGGAGNHRLGLGSVLPNPRRLLGPQLPEGAGVIRSLQVLHPEKATAPTIQPGHVHLSCRTQDTCSSEQKLPHVHLSNTQFTEVAWQSLCSRRSNNDLPGPSFGGKYIRQ